MTWKNLSASWSKGKRKWHRRIRHSLPCTKMCMHSPSRERKNLRSLKSWRVRLMQASVTHRSTRSQMCSESSKTRSLFKLCKSEPNLIKLSKGSSPRLRPHWLWETSSNLWLWAFRTRTKSSILKLRNLEVSRRKWKNRSTSFQPAWQKSSVTRSKHAA